METTRYVRKPFFVDAVRVTDDNMAEVAEWSGGSIRTKAKPIHETQEIVDAKYIKVNVKNAKYPRQTQAFVGDWVLRDIRDFRVYTNSAFERSFEQPENRRTVIATGVRPSVQFHKTNQSE